ncbi:S-layer homology domain-containing protein [Paeniglutamicibacter gangotriensis]|uniref:S-layer homology domain-containing protein n=1 Tax=Paeniglutamicibacter gangotriensis TaxID=254787 RepID=A0A5B0E6J4_9MICC|nr:S-layer homology domain-containing protein [Paeniglutamicibacter gangotriensis]KAA0973551.1 S-layer homology domain-containing protein [Paeniglutamicibacter gangotriensis]
MIHKMSRRSLLIGATLLPLTALAIKPAMAAASNSTAGFGALVKQIGMDTDTWWPAMEYSAKVYENGISVTRRGLTMSRKSKLGLAKLWHPGLGFPTADVRLLENGSYGQEFQGVTTWWEGGSHLGSQTTHPIYDEHPRSFKDVSDSHDFYREIEVLSTLGVTEGWPDGTFRPQATILRDAFAAFCYRMKGSPAYKPPVTSPFKDVPTNNIFYKEICWAESQGIVNGWSNGMYKPFEPIKRDAVAAMLYRMAPTTAYSFMPLKTLGFVDVPKSNIFYREIEWMRSTGISIGWEKDTFVDDMRDWTREYRPLNTATRAEAAAFLVRWNERFGIL